MRAIPVIALLLSFAVTGGVALGAPEQAPGDAMAARLSADKVGDIAAGSYMAGDRVAFSLQNYGDHYLLRFADSPEIFVLAMDRVALGGRELKYDSGATALRVSIWGGITLYTDSAPGGLPATRIGDFVPPPAQRVSEADLLQALRDESAHLAYVEHVTVKFSAAPGNDQARAEAFSALISADAAIERILASAPGRNAWQRHIETVKLVESAKPGVALAGHTLTVRFAPARGPAGSPSSHAIATALGKYLAIPEPG